MNSLRHLNLLIAALLLGSAHAQLTLCPGEPVQFALEDNYHGDKTWEFSPDGVNWEAITVVEDTPFTLQPEQSGWYRVRFHDADCDSSYVSNTVRLATHAIDVGDAMTIAIGGVVRNELGGPVSGATVRAGCGAGVSTTTDHFGVFLLQGVAAYEGLAHVTVEKEGYFTGSRSFVPGENAEDAISHAYITLLQKNLAGTVDGAAGGAVTLEGVNITFPADGFTQNGGPYAGSVSVSLNHIDPTSEDLYTQMPGMLMGVMNDEPQLMLSYGMVGVELTDANGQAVQLAPGSPATVRFPVIAAQQSDAPASIPLWWFDEDLGYWIQEGEAALVGNEYVGQVAHFSWWNCDVPGNFVELKGVVLDNATGAVLPGAQIMVSTQTMGSGTTYTNSMGEVVCQVPLGQQLTITVQLPCGPNGSWITVHEEVAGPYAQPGVIILSVTIPDQKLVTGTVVDCDGVPVNEGYVLVNGVAHFCTDAVFELFTCAANITMRGVDVATGNVSAYTMVELLNDTTDMGDLVACTPLFGTVTDIDGNTYQTVIIGNQEWMAENLRTATFANSDPIPNVTVGSVWSQLNSASWCNYQNNPVNDPIYGKLYNWYAVSDPGNICPAGWHMPTDTEWQQLEVVLGMPSGEVNSMGSRGSVVNVGGKLKAVTMWSAPNTGASNESGFSGLPGGFRNFSNGSFNQLVYYGSWWSVSESGEDYAWCRGLEYVNGGIDRINSSKRGGYSVRCVRD